MSARYVDHSAAAKAELIEQLKPVATKMGEAMKAEILEGMRAATPTGKRRGLHTSSAPGEPPAIHSHRYERSWTETEPEVEGTRVVVRVYSVRRVPGTNRSLADVLEHGSSKMKPRPHIRPATARVAPKLLTLAGEVGRATPGAA